MYKKSLNWLGKKRKKFQSIQVHEYMSHMTVQSPILCTRFTILERFPSKSIYWFDFDLKGFQFSAVLASHCCTTEMELGTRALVWFWSQTMLRLHAFLHSPSKSDRCFYLNDHNFFLIILIFSWFWEIYDSIGCKSLRKSFFEFFFYLLF